MDDSQPEERDEERSPNVSINNSPGDHRIAGRDLIEVNINFGNVDSSAESHNEEHSDREHDLCQAAEIKMLIAAIRNLIPKDYDRIRFPRGGQKVRTH